MKLKSLEIEEIRWGENEGQYRANITFSSDRGSVTTHLSPREINKVLSVVADALVETSKEVAQDLTAEIINQSNMLLERKEAE